MSEVIVCKVRVTSIHEKVENAAAGTVQTVSIMKLEGGGVLKLPGSYSTDIKEIEIRAELEFGKTYEIIARLVDKKGKAVSAEGRKFNED